MLRVAVIVISIVGIVAFLVLGILAVIPWQISGIMITVFVGIGGLVLNYLSREKAHVKESQITEKTTIKQTEMPQQYVIVDETNAISRGYYVTHDLGQMNPLVEVKGEISSNEPVDFYILTEYELDRFEKDKEFTCQYSRESSLKSKMSFIPSETRELYLVIENIGRKQAVVHVNLYV